MKKKSCCVWGSASGSTKPEVNKNREQTRGCQRGVGGWGMGEAGRRN